MSWLKKGPDLKLSGLRSGDLKMPPMLTDLYYDLRDRRLLPLVALAIVGIVAVPFLLGGSSKEEEEASVPTPASAGAVAGASSAGSGSSRLAVVESKPGLRDYKKRLSGKPTNPFHQKFTAPQLKGTELTHTTESSSGSSGPTTFSSGSGSPSETPTAGAPPSSSPSGAPGVPPGKVKIFFFAYAIDVRIAKSEATGSAVDESLAPRQQAASDEAPGQQQSNTSGEGDSSVRREVMPYTKLPGEKAPVVTYMGPSKRGNPMLLVSSKVKTVFGEQRCVSGDDSCQLMEVAVGFPVVLIYGEGETQYKLEVLKMERVVTGTKVVDTPQNFSK